MSKGIPYEKILQHFNQQPELIIASSDRIARSVQQGYFQHLSRQKKTIATPLKCLSYKQWVRQSFDLWQVSQLDDRLLLSSSVTEFLLSQIIKNDPDTVIMNPAGTAKQVLAALNLSTEWLFDREQLALSSSFETGRLLHWQQLLEDKCHAYRWIPSYALVSNTIAAIRQNEITPPKSVLWLGFDEFPPALEQIKTLFESGGTLQQHYYHQLDQEADIYFASAHDSITECQMVANQVFHYWQQHPDEQIAVVLPDLEKRIDHIQHQFSQVFHPETQITGQSLAEPIFNISAGLYLDNISIVNACLRLWTLRLDNIETADLEFMLVSPYCTCLDNDTHYWTSAIASWHHNGRDSMSLESIQKSMTHYQQRHETDLSQSLFEVAEARAFKTTSLAEISHQLIQELQLWGVIDASGQGRALDQSEQDALSSLFLILDDLKQFQMTQNTWRRHEVLALLQKLVSETVYQKAASNRRIHILGTLEAAGLVFDRVFMMGMNDESWPASPSPNPFIPASVQKQFQLPRSSAERELKVAQSITAHIKQACKNLHVSFAQYTDEKQVSLSPLFEQEAMRIEEGMRVQESDSLAVPPQGAMKPLSTQWIIDTKAPALGQGEAARGGTSLLKAQAACPFQAFAKFRLQIKEQHKESLGLNPRERGLLVHRVLELVWQTMKTQQGLLELDNEALHHLIDQKTQQSIQELCEQQALQRSEAFWQLEANKLSKMVVEWLQMEKHRTPFEVESMELDCEAQVGPIRVKFQVDRVDKLPNDKKILIDYKTSTAYQAKHWGGVRPEEPQMLLYGTHLDNVAAIAYAQVTPKQLIFSGIADDDNLLPRVKPLSKDQSNNWDLPNDWQDMLAKWRKVLHDLGSQFARGEAEVNPKVAINTCKYCQFQGVCRINEHQPDAT